MDLDNYSEICCFLAAAYDLAAKDSNSSKREKMIALFDYNPHEHSPNADAEAELPLHAGDVIYVIGEVDEDGFYEVRKGVWFGGWWMN
jgi:RIMS-binding protein 2